MNNVGAAENWRAGGVELAAGGAGRRFWAKNRGSVGSGVFRCCSGRASSEELAIMMCAANRGWNDMGRFAAVGW